MAQRRNKNFYTDLELKAIREQWLIDKGRVDQETEGFYPRDKDHAYIKYFCNRNLQAMFRFATYLYHGAIIEGDLFLYPDEETLVVDVYERMKNNGYYDQSKQKEKSVRTRLGIAVKRQTYRKYWKK